MKNIAILGNGVVGSGTARVLLSKAEKLKAETGEDINLKYVFVRHDYEGCEYRDLFEYDYDTIKNDKEIDIVAEVMGGVHPAYEYVKDALLRGRSVVTSNKQLIAECGCELMNIAKEKNVNLLFEGAVAGAVPVIHGIRNCLKANDVKRVYGIINGTTNYILSKMISDGQSYADALKKAQELGYAEADPSRDVDGIDSCRKLCILADIVYGNHIMPQTVNTIGIRDIEKTDTDILSQNKKAIKLLGYAAKAENGKTIVCTEPFVVSDDSVLFATNDAFNAVAVETDNADTIVFYGRGAGSFPTASAVVNDIVECINAENTIYPAWGAERNDLLESYENFAFKHYVRADISAAKVKELFADAVILSEGEECAFLTSEMSENSLSEKLEGISVKAKYKTI